MSGQLKGDGKQEVTYEPASDRSSDIPFTEFQIALEQVVDRIKFPPARNAARNVFVHLRKSWALHPVDAEMSLFRAITAEEEAATALVRALRLRKYPGAQALNPRNHAHKSSIWPLIRSIATAMDDKGVTKPEIRLATKGRPRIELMIDLAKVARTEGTKLVLLVDPFDFVIRSDRQGPFDVHTFAEELHQLATQRGAESIAGYVNAEANLRNQVLYASSKGVPAVIFQDDLILERAKRATVILVAAIGVLQTRKVQAFMVQCVDALLRAVTGSTPPIFAYPEMDFGGRPFLQIAEQEGGSMQVSWVQKDRIDIPWGLRFSSWPLSWR